MNLLTALLLFPQLNIKQQNKQQKFLEKASLSGVQNQAEVEKQCLTMRQEEIYLLKRFLKLIELRKDLYTSYLSFPSVSIGNGQETKPELRPHNATKPIGGHSLTTLTNF